MTTVAVAADSATCPAERRRIVLGSVGSSLSTAMVGDGMFLLASAMGATYMIQVQRRRLDPIVAAALVPVIGAACSTVDTGEAISIPELAAIGAISARVALASRGAR